jgi:RNA recognition motif-containing protein
MKLIALNLPRQFDERDLEKLFRAHGTVTACTVVMDEVSGASKGFGFVEMSREEDATAAIEKLHGTKVKKHKIRVKPAN